MLPLVYTSRGFGPFYLNVVLSVVQVFRIKQDAATKVSAGFRGSWGSGRQGKRGFFLLCWWKMLHWQLRTLKSWVYPKNTQGLIRGKTILAPTSLPGLAGPQPKCPQPWPEPFHGGGMLGLHIHFHLASRVKAGRWWVSSSWCFFVVWQLPNERENEGESQTSPEHFSLHFKAVSQAWGGGNISQVIPWDNQME